MASLFGSYTDSLSSYYGAITRKNVIQKYICMQELLRYVYSSDSPGGPTLSHCTVTLINVMYNRT